MVQGPMMCRLKSFINEVRYENLTNLDRICYNPGQHQQNCGVFWRARAKFHTEIPLTVITFSRSQSRRLRKFYFKLKMLINLRLIFFLQEAALPFLAEKFMYAETENNCSLLIFRDYIPFEWLA